MKPSARWHLGYLDSLRGVAVLAVVMVHSSLRNNLQIPLPEALRNITGTGQRGVALFFLVSAFTLFLSHDNRKDESNPTRNFFIRRFFRLAPMMYVGMVLSYVFLPQFMGDRVGITASALFLGGFHPVWINSGTLGGWSIADEALFYACLPFLFVRIRSLNTALWWLATGLVSGVVLSRLLCHLFPQYTEHFEFFSFTAQYPIFLIGIAGYFVWKELMPFVEQRKQASIMLLIFAIAFYRSLLPFHYRNLYQESLVALLLLLALALHPWALFVNPLTRFLGRISYSIYILHFVPCIYLQGAVSGFSPVTRLVLCLCGTLAVTVPVAYVTWRWIEEPGIEVGRRLIRQLEAYADSRIATSSMPR